MRRVHNFISIKGQKFNRLFVLEFAYRKNKHTYWKCLCDCGNIKIIEAGNLKNGNTKSCGCLRSDKASERMKLLGKDNPGYKHGLSYTKAYINDYAAMYRARKSNQTPQDANLKKIQLYYNICSYLNEKAIYYHVDHIQPISKGGLHEADNLQILDAELNLEKLNKYPLSRAEEIRYKGIRI